MTGNYTKQQASALSGLTLAFFGDSVYEVLVREKIVTNGNMPVNKLHNAAVEMVKAGFQAAAYEFILPHLTEEEQLIAKRGRNATGNKVPRSSNPKDYRRATGLEALFGYLYLIGDDERISTLFKMICDARLSDTEGGE